MSDTPEVQGNCELVQEGELRTLRRKIATLEAAALLRNPENAQLRGERKKSEPTYVNALEAELDEARNTIANLTAQRDALDLLVVGIRREFAAFDERDTSQESQ